ncbi:hypothetical protein LI951_00695 [Enterococcus sp. BWT-B8]|uniref:hypothetical protein n=1 Tax=unclassified Enterococcus TaxID=2608891 RepID=UPI001E4DEC37|nr:MULTISPECIES: hypothetical protein [unclassified Enterococcus]MCB5950577.1 hypothetical protein [Enterococcus sp. BWT-B8]MCB5955902.1 hypothetical protein [Enterococcus sp. CWB-B31]
MNSYVDEQPPEILEGRITYISEKNEMEILILNNKTKELSTLVLDFSDVIFDKNGESASLDSVNKFVSMFTVNDQIELTYGKGTIDSDTRVYKINSLSSIKKVN